MRTRIRFGSVAAAVALAALVGGGVVTHTREACAQQKTSFAGDVLPIFKGRCMDCHRPGGAGYDKSGLDLSTYEGLMKGTKLGAVVIPGDAEGSNLVWLLDWRASAELRMPHGQKQLSICDRNAIRAWIFEGARNN